MGRPGDDDGAPVAGIGKDTFACKYKGKKRQFKVAQINLMLLDETGTKPVVSWLLQKIEGWEYSQKKQELTLKVDDAGSTSIHVLKLADDEGQAALDAIDANVQGLVEERKRLRKEQKKQQKAAGKEGDRGPEEKTVGEASVSSDGTVTAKMLPCKVKGKKRQLKVAQMNLMLFDEAGTKPVDSWLYEKLEGWEYDEKKNTLALKVSGAEGAVVHSLKMTWPEDAKLALDGIQANINELVAERKRLKREEKARNTVPDDLQERINKALSESCKDIEHITKILDDAKTARHVHPSVLSLQKKLGRLRAAPETEQEGGSDADEDSESESEQEEQEESDEDEPEYSTTEEEEQGELTLQDKIDDALEEAFTDVAAMKALLKEAHAAKHVHPSVISLGNKIETLEADDEEEDEMGDTLGELPASRPKKKLASSARRMSVAEEGVKGVVEEAAIASLGMEGVVPEKMFKVALKKKKKVELQFKVGQMNCQLFDGPQMLGSWLYLSMHEWQYLPKSQIFDMTVPKPSGGGKTEKIELYSIDGVGEEIAELMTQHAKNIAKQIKADKKAAANTADSPAKSTFGGSTTTFDCKFLGKKRQLKVGSRNIMVVPEGGTGSPIEVWDFEVKLKGWEWSGKRKLLLLNVLTAAGEAEEKTVGVSMKKTDGHAALEAIDASIQALVLEKRAAKQKAKQAQLLADAARQISDDSQDADANEVDSSQDDAGAGTGVGWRSDPEPAAANPDTAPIVDVSPPERYKVLNPGLIREGVSVDSAKVGRMQPGTIYTVTKLSSFQNNERMFVGEGWVSPVARTGKRLLEKIGSAEQEESQSTREKCEASVRSFISLRGPEYRSPSVASRVIKALESYADPEEWVPGLEDMDTDGSLDEFLAACRADTSTPPDDDVQKPSDGDQPVGRAAEQVEANDTDEETVESTASTSRDESRPSTAGSTSDDWLLSDAETPAEFESPHSPEPEPEPELEPSKIVEPIDINAEAAEVSYSVFLDSDGSAVTLQIMAQKIRLAVGGKDTIEDVRFQDIRSWWDVGNKVCFVLKEDTSTSMGSTTTNEPSIVLRCEQDHAMATEIAQSVAAAVTAAASILSPTSAAMLPTAPTALPAGSYRVWHGEGSDMAELILSVEQDSVVLRTEEVGKSLDQSQVFREIPYISLRSWTADEHSITLTAAASGSDDSSPFVLKSKQPAVIAESIAEAARKLSRQRVVEEAERARAEALEAAAEQERRAAAAEMERLQREKEQLKLEKEAEAAALAEAAAEAKRAQEAEIAKMKAEMEAALQQQRQELATAAAAASDADAAAARQAAKAEADARRSAEATEIAKLKAEIVAEHEAQAARSAALEKEREAALERTRQLELIAMSKGRAAEMDAKLQATAAAALEEEIKAETLATQQEEAAKQSAVEASRRADATPNPSFEPVTGASPSPQAAAAASVDVKPSSADSALSMSARAAALAAVPTPTPDRTGEIDAVALTDRQLALGQAALSTLTERLEEMHRKDPSMLSSARFDALCNTIGDYSQNPSSVALEDVVKTTVRLAGAFKSDAAFAKQLQRKVFANPTVMAGSTATGAGGSTAPTVAKAEHTGNLVQSLQNEVATLRQEIMRLGTIIQDPASPRLSPIQSPEEGRRVSYPPGSDPTTVAQTLMDSAEELQQPTEASAEASVRSLYEAQSAADRKQRNADRSFAGRLLTLQAQLEQGLITDAQYSDEKRRLSQLAASESSPTSAPQRLEPVGAAASPERATGDGSMGRHANGAPRIKKDVARSLALACLLRQVSIGELLPVVRSHLGVASISELEELEPADLNAVSLSPLHRRRLLRALDYVKNDVVKDALLEGERLARSGDIQAAIQQCRHALTLGPAGGLAPSPTPRDDDPSEQRADRGLDGETHDYHDPDSDFFCDITGRTLRLGEWWHKVGSSYDLCADEYHKLPHGSARAGFLLVSKLSDLGNDRRRYGHGATNAAAAMEHSAPDEGVPPAHATASPRDPVRPPANRQLRQDIEKMAAYVMRHGGVGGDFDQIARRKQKNNPRFAFMFGGEGALYYNYVTAELTRRMAQSAAQGLATAHKRVAAAAARRHP